MRIKLFEQFYKATVLDEVNDCLVDLRDNGFEWSCSYEQLHHSVLDMSLYKIDRSGFRIGDIKDSLETMIDYFDEKYGVTSYTCRKPNSPGPGIEVKLYDESDESIQARQGKFNNLYYLNIQINLGDEGIKGINNIVRSYESSEFDEDELTTNYNKWVNDQNNRDKILQEINELLVELSDSKFDVTSNYIVKDGKNILELWIERVVPDFEYDDWYNDRADIFTIGEVYEPLALLTDWMREKYNAVLVDDGMNTETFHLDGTLNAVNAEAFDIDNLDKNYYGKSYLKNRVSALFVKYVW